MTKGRGLPPLPPPRGSGGASSPFGAGPGQPLVALPRAPGEDEGRERRQHGVPAEVDGGGRSQGSRRNKGGKRVRGEPPDRHGGLSGPLQQGGSSREGASEERSGGGRQEGAAGGKRKTPDTGGQPHRRPSPDSRIGPEATAVPFPQQFQYQQQQQQPLQPQFQVQPQHQIQMQQQPQIQMLQPQFQYQWQPQIQMQQPQFQFQTMVQPQPPHQQRLFLIKVDESPASYNTRWEELHPDSQSCLLQIEARILEYRSESQSLDQCSRLRDSSVANNGFEPDATRIIQKLTGISIAMERKKILVKKLIISAKDMMRNADSAIRSFMILHPRFPHPSATVTSNVDLGSQTARAASAFSAQTMTNSVRAHDFYAGLPKRPSPFFTVTVREFERDFAECRQWVEELEQLLHLDTKRAFSRSETLLGCLPSVLSNEYDYFIYVAAKVENLHLSIESMKTIYLAGQRWRGDANNPFLEAHRRETAKLEAAARRVHPTLHLPPVPSGPSGQVAGLFASSATLGASTASHQSLGTAGGFPGSGFSMFSTPSSAAAFASTSSSLFSNPSSSAPTPICFSSCVLSPQSIPFGSTQTPSLFGASSPAFASTPATGSSPMPSFASGAATGSEASRALKPKAPKRNRR